MSNYAKYWDKYVDQLFPNSGKRDDVVWPGDEWGQEQRWRQIFAQMFEPYGVTEWKMAAEIGQGSGKYTSMVFGASPECKIATFDVSEQFLKVCGERLAAEKEAGRLHLNVLEAKRADEMILTIERLGMARQLDAFYSMDAMVHVDLQYLTAYFLTAALALKKGGHLIMTLADASTEHGFNYLINRIDRFYGHQGEPIGKFEFISRDIARNVLTRLGFEIVHMSNPPNEVGRDIRLVARLVDTEPGRRLGWALAEEPGPNVQHHATEPAPALSWEPIPDGDYAVEFSLNKFGRTIELGAGPVVIPAGGQPTYTIPEGFWSAFPLGRRLYWRVIGRGGERYQRLAQGMLVRNDKAARRGRPQARDAQQPEPADSPFESD